MLQIKNFFTNFGEITSKKAIAILFYLGTFPIITNSYLFGKEIYLSHQYEQQIVARINGTNHYTSRIVNNTPLGILSGIIAFIIIFFIWKIICELALIFFRYFENNSYTK